MGNVLPKVTIGIPFFNAEATLMDAVRSVFAQTHREWELILIDDGSTDRSLEYAQSIDDPRVRVYSDGQNRRLATRLNEIARLARFDFVARMDADDLMSRSRLERQLRVLTDNDSIDLVSAGVVSMADDWRATGVRCVPKGHCITSSTVLAGNSGIVHAAVVARRSWFLRNQYDESLKVSQDTNLWIRAFANDDLRARVLAEPLYFYREDGNVTYTKLKEAYRVQRRTISAVASRYSRRQRVSAYSVSAIKSMLAFAAHRSGRLNLIRARRNATPLSKGLSATIQQEVRAILATPLPIRTAPQESHGH